MRSRVTQFALILTTMFAMLASSVSACTCGHHEEKADDSVMPSCHGSHEKAAVDPGVETIDAPCICYVSLPPPFIIGNTEQRSVDHEQEGPAGLSQAFFAVLQPVATALDAENFHSDTPIYLSRALAFTPSRAPPRL